MNGNGNGSTLDSVLSGLGQLGRSAGEIIGALNRPPSVVPPAPPPQQQVNWGLIAGIGAAVLGLFVLVALLAGRK